MARRIHCTCCGWSTVIRKEDVSSYDECGLGGTVHQIANRLRDDHWEGMDECSPTDVEITLGTYDEWTRDFMPEGTA